MKPLLSPVSALDAEWELKQMAYFIGSILTYAHRSMKGKHLKWWGGEREKIRLRDKQREREKASIN